MTTADRRTTLDSGLASVTRGTVLLFVASLLFIAFTFVWRVVLVRTLAPVDWSVFSLGLAYAGLFSSVGGLGLGNTLARNIPYARDDDERRAIVRGALGVGALAAALSGVGMFVVGQYVGATVGSSLVTESLELFSLSVAFSVFAGILVSVFQGYEDVGPNAYFLQIGNPLLFLVFLAVLAAVPSLPYSFLTALWAYVLASAGVLGLTVLYTVRHLPRRLSPGPRAPGMLAPTLAFALPLLFVAVSGYVAGYGDTLVLGAYSVIEVGTYAASLSMARLLTIGVGALSFIFLPVASRYYAQRDLESIRTLYVTATKWIVLASLPFFLVFVWRAGNSLALVYGSAYASNPLPLEIVTTGAFLSTLVGPAASVQVAFGQGRALLVNSVIAAVVDLLLAIVLVPSYGITGAAIAWAASTAVYPALSLLEIAWWNGVHPFYLHFGLPLAATLVPLGILFVLLPAGPIWTLPLLGGLAVVWFVGATIATRSIDEGDRRLLYAVEGLLKVRLGLVRRLGRFALRPAQPDDRSARDP